MGSQHTSEDVFVAGEAPTGANDPYWVANCRFLGAQRAVEQCGEALTTSRVCRLIC